MPGALKETRLTDFFQRRQQPILVGNDTLSRSSTLASLQLAPTGDPSPPVVAKRKSGRPKRSKNKTHDEPIHVSLESSPLSRGSHGRRVLRSSYHLRSGSGTSGPSSTQQQSGKPKGRKETANKVAARSSLNSDSRNFCSITPFLHSASEHRSTVLHNSSKEHSYSPRALTPSKRKLDDDDDATGITSGKLQNGSSPGSSNAPESSLTTDDFPSGPSNKRHRLDSPRVLLTTQGPFTPKKTRGVEEIIPTSQSNEIGLYSPIRANNTPRQRIDVQESVENWRHGRSAYRCDNVSPLRFVLGDDYFIETDRSLSPCPQSSIPGSSLSSLTNTDAILSDVEPEDLPIVLPQNTLPTPSSCSEVKAYPPVTQVVMSPVVRPVTPPPSSPEQGRTGPVPVAAKDSKTRTAEIIAEIWANVRAKSPSDSEDSYLHAPIKDELSSEEEDDEPFWKTNNTSARHVVLASTADSASRRPFPPSPSSPPHSQFPISPDDSSPNDSLPRRDDHNDYTQRVPIFPISDPVSPIADIRKRRARSCNVTRGHNPSTLAAKPAPAARKTDPIKAMLRERQREERAGRGIDALNRAEGYGHDTLLSNFNFDDAEEPVDAAVPTESGSMDEDTNCVAPTSLQTYNASAISAANALEDEIQQDERERLLGAKEGEAVGKILDADRKMGQTVNHSVPGISVFDDNHEEIIDTQHGNEARPKWESTKDKDKAATLEMLSEAIEQQDVEYMQAVFGILTAEDMVVPGVAQWLCEQALWYGHEDLGRFSRKFLLEMPLWAQSYPGSPLTVDLLVQTMMRFGLRKDLSIHVPALRNAMFPRLQNRPRVLESMVKMIAWFASRWSVEQLPDVVIVLLLIGVNMDTTAELRRDVLHSVSLLCRRLPVGPGDGIEIAVAERVMELTRALSSSDQALLLSFFTKGSPSSLRIARAVAHHVLTDLSFSTASYALPPLGPLVVALSNPDGPFGITDSTDYDALTSHIGVLSVALSGIESYVAEESTFRKLAANVSDGSPRKKETVPLELIRVQLDAMHGKIFDTRAAHLDRSRAKGAIQRLSMRIHYQRAALSKTRGQLCLGDFFSPGSNSRQPKRRNWL